MTPPTPRRVLARAAATFAIAAMALPFASGDVGPVRAASTTLVISEFRYRGPSADNDEFIEIANITGSPITIADTLGGVGFAIVPSDGTPRCIIPNGTVISPYGHYLCVNSLGYSLATYPAGNGTSATGDATYTTPIADNSGIALFDTSTPAGFTLGHRVDAVGTTAEANALYREGPGLTPSTGFSVDGSWFRNLSTGSTQYPAPQTATPGVAEDTDDNASDFVYVNTNGSAEAGTQRLGAPGPQNLSSPVATGGIGVSLLDPCVSRDAPPNLVRDFTSDPPNNSDFGTLEYRRTITNNTGGNVTRLRARIVDARTFPVPPSYADLRARTTTDVVVTVDRAPCGSGTSNVTVNGTTLEQTPAPNQPNGGGFDSSLSFGDITLATPLANGASLDVRFLFGVKQVGINSVDIVIEAAPTDWSAPTVVCLAGTYSDMPGQCVPPAVTSESYTTTALVPVADNVLANDTDIDGETLIASLVTAPSGGALVLNADGSFIYTPNAGFTGTDSFVYAVDDGTSPQQQGTASFVVEPPPVPPVAADDAYTTPYDTALQVDAPGVLGNDTDADGDPFTAQLVTGPAYGTLSLNPDGSFTYTPNGGFAGTDTFAYVATQGPQQPTSAAAAVTITVAPPPTTTTTSTTAESPSTTTTTPAVTPPSTLPTTTAVVPALPTTGGQAGRSAAWGAALLLLGLGLSATAALSRRHARR